MQAAMEKKESPMQDSTTMERDDPADVNLLRGAYPHLAEDLAASRTLQSVRGCLTRHRPSAHRHGPGLRRQGIHREGVVTTAGFGRADRIAHHPLRPARVRKVEPAGVLAVQTVEQEVLRRHYLKTGGLTPERDP